jgi:hypothetical protein
VTEQLQLDFDAVCSRLRDQIKRAVRDHRLDGATRLLLGLLRATDLDPAALEAAAALALELDLLALEQQNGNGNGAAA